MKSVYEECSIYKCSIYKRGLITLRKTNDEDLGELLECYSNEKAVPLFNSDNCHGDDFNYTTIEQMGRAIEFWEASYKNKEFVRWTVILKGTNKKLGTIEMFHRNVEDEFNHYGILRIDLQSKYEIQSIIEDILAISNECFFEAFEVKGILTKAVPKAEERISALKKAGFKPVYKKVMEYDDYYCREV